MPEFRITETAWTVELERKALAALAAVPIDHAKVGDAGPVFSIDTPPPYPSGKWHIGAVAGYSLIDMIARSRRASGERVLFPWGVDRNGINIELVVEKKTNKRLSQWDRAEFNTACRDAIGDNTRDLEAIARRVALSCDFDNKYETDAPEYRAVTQRTFIDLFRKGAVVEDLRPNAYDPLLGTTIADAEVYYEERETNLVHVRWTIKETGETVVIATTRPELICACRAVLVHPDDARNSHLVGKHAVLPVYGRTVPIQAHPHVAMEFGSGVMMVCSFGDQADVQLFRELSLEPIAAIDVRGRMSAAAGAYEGLKVAEARTKITEDLQAAGAVEKVERVRQKFPTSERSKAAVELILLKEWYVRQLDCLDDLRRHAKAMAFHPDKHRQILLDWVDSITNDWPVSRRRYYHTEIPLWYLDDAAGKRTDHVVIPAPGPYYQPWREAPPPDADVYERSSHKRVARLDEFLARHPGLKPVGEDKVFDTWMDSSVSNLYILGYHRDTAWFQAHYPCSLRPQGRDIVRTWLYYTVLRNHHQTGQQAFEHAWIHGLGMDASGRKMSKSLGNVIDPERVLEKEGADAFRFWIASECTIGDDFRISEDRIAGARKFITKLYNVSRFASGFTVPAPDGPAPKKAINRWIRAEFDAVRAECVAGYDGFDFFRCANAIRDFVWNLFAPHYIEMAKADVYAGDEETLRTVHGVISGVLRLLAPIAPIMPHAVHKQLYGGDVHVLGLPEPLAGDAALRALTPRIEAFNNAVWKQKQDAGLKQKDPLSGVEIPDGLKPLERELRALHSLQ